MNYSVLPFRQALVFQFLFLGMAAGNGQGVDHLPSCETHTTGAYSFTHHAPYDLRTWTANDGLPQNSIMDIVQSPDGYLWLATFGGLVRFDGDRFKTFDLASAQGLPSNRISSITVDNCGTLWIGTEGGHLCRFYSNRFEELDPESAGARGTIWDIVTDSTGGVWIAHSNGLSCFTRGAFRTFGIEDGLPRGAAHGLHVARNGMIWLILFDRDEGAHHVFYLDNDRFIRLDPAQTGNAYGKSLAEDASGRIWFSSGKGLVSVRNKEIHTQLPANEKGSHSRILFDNHGHLWFAGDGALRVADREPRPPETDLQSLSVFNYSRSIRKIFQDRESNIWIGLDGEGLHQVRRRRADEISIQVAGDITAPRWYASAGNDRVIVGLGCRHIIQTNGEAFEHFLPTKEHGCYDGLVRHKDGTSWMWNRAEILRTTADSETRFGLQDGIPAKRSHLHLDRDGNPWVGGPALHRFDGKRFHEVPGTSGVLGRIDIIEDDPNGWIWFGGMGGVGRFDGKGVRYFEVDDGVSRGVIRTLHATTDGAIWVGSYGGGLSRIKNSSVRTITTEDGLCENVVSKIIEDQQGRLWMHGNTGICAASVTDLNAVMDGNQSSANCISIETTEGWGAAGLQAPDGKLWFASINGATIVDPASFQLNEVEPGVVIESITVEGESFESKEAIVVSSRDRDLEIQYAGLSFVEPDRVRFRYRLEGYDDHWVDAGNRRIAIYSNLSPGHYRFHVKACNNDGVWNETGAAISIAFEAAFFETAWFWALSITTIVITGFVAVRDRTRRYQTRNRRLEAEIDERKAVEAALRDNEEKLRAVFDQTFQFVGLLSPEGSLLAANSRVLEFAGVAAQDILGKKIWEAPHCSHSEVVKNKVHDAVVTAAQGENVRIETTHRDRHGESRDVELSIKPVYGPDGRIIYLHQEGQDTTERKRTERALHALVKGTAGATDQAFFERLVQHLATVLQMRYAMIAYIDPDQPDQATTMAVWADDKIVDAFTYSLNGTPCQEVARTGTCAYSGHVQSQFPDDRLLVDMGVESYLGIPLHDAERQVLGILAVMDSRPLVQTELSTQLLELFAIRASTELARSRAAVALAEREEKYRDFIATNLAGIRLFEMQTPMPTDLPLERQVDWMLTKLILRECNDVFAEMYGRENAAAILGCTLSEIWGSDGEPVRSVVRKFIEDGYQFKGTVTAEPLPDGSIKQFLNMGLSIFQDGKIARVWGTQIDVTQQMQMEESLRVSEERLRTLMENVPGAIYRFEAKRPRKILHISDAIESITGYAAKEFRDNAHSYDSLIACEDCDRYQDVVEKAVEDGVPYHLEYRVRCADGTERWVRDAGRPMDASADSPAFLDGVILDITQEKQADEQRSVLVDRLRQAQKLETVGTLTAGVAHDTRNMLSAVLGGLDLAEMSRHDETALLRSLNDVRSAASQCADIVQSLVTASRPEDSVKSVINLREIIQKTLPMLVRVLPESVRLETTSTGAAVYVEGNASQLNQILLNLLVNASQAMPSGGTIKLECESLAEVTELERGIDQAWVRLSVADNGGGMNEEVRKRAMEPFFTTRSREQGTGLGLAVVHGIVEDHGGRIDIQSEVGIGTRVLIDLPQQETVPSRDIQPEVQGAGSRSQGQTILVMERDRRVRATIAEVLEKKGYVLRQASTLQEGVEHVDSDPRRVRVIVASEKVLRDGDPEMLDRLCNIGMVLLKGPEESSRLITERENVAIVERPFSLHDLTETVSALIRRIEIVAES